MRLRLGSLGSPQSRAAYLDELREFLRSHEADVSKEVRERIDANPLRAFDADDEGTRKVMAEAPTILERLDSEDAEHSPGSGALLDHDNVSYDVDPTLVRGLDYYTRTVFEFESERLGAQSGLGGGGRYDGLVEQLGGRPTPAAGWAAGIERIALALGEAPEPERDGIFIVADEDSREQAFALVAELRRAGHKADLDLASRTAKGQMKHADRSGAAKAILLEDSKPAVLRNLESGEQREIDTAKAVEELG